MPSSKRPVATRVTSEVDLAPGAQVVLPAHVDRLAEIGEAAGKTGQRRHRVETE